MVGFPRIFQVGKYCPAFLLLLVLSGCQLSQSESSEETETRQYKYTSEQISMVISNIEATADETRQHYDVDAELAAHRHALELVEHRQVGNKPLLISAIVKQDAQQSILIPSLLDRDGDALGIIVIEYDTHSGQLLAEMYPVFDAIPASGRKSGFFFPIFLEAIPRRDGSHTKNSAAWADWIAEREAPPPVIVSLPRDGLVVQLAAYDKEGNISPFTPLQFQRYSETD